MSRGKTFLDFYFAASVEIRSAFALRILYADLPVDLFDTESGRA